MINISNIAIQQVNGGRFGPLFWTGFSIYKTHLLLQSSGAYESFGRWSYNDGNFRASQKF